MLALQLALGEAQAAVGAGHPVAPEQLVRGHRRLHVEQVHARGAAQRDDRVDLDQRLPSGVDVPAAAQRAQRSGAVEPGHRAGGVVRGRVLDRDPRLGRALDVELQHVLMGQLHGDALLSRALLVISCRANSAHVRCRRKQPVRMQHFLNLRADPHTQGSLRPSFSRSSLSPWTTRWPRLTLVSDG